MKTKAFLLVTAILFSMSGFSQQLLDIYKKGTVKLVADPEFGKANNWEKAMELYNDIQYGKPVGKRMNLLVKPDGSVIVNHAYQNFYSQYDANGNYTGKLTVKNENGKELKTPNIEGIINDNTFFTGLTNMGKMTCFDFAGKYIKTLTLDYMSRQIIALPNNKLVAVGWVIWSDRFRDFISIVDYNTNEEKIIWEHFTSRSKDMTYKDKKFMYGHALKSGGAMSVSTMPYLNTLGFRPSPNVVFAKNKLIVAIPTTGEILEYSTEGQLLNKSKVSWKNSEITIEEQTKIQKDAIDKYSESIKRMKEEPEKNSRDIEAYTAILTDMKSDLGKITEPIPMPYFSAVIKDSDDNLLFFEHPKDEGANKFNVYTYNSEGNFACQSSFQCDDYNLVINPSKLVFFKGYLYGIQELKSAQGIPARLVKFKITN